MKKPLPDRRSSPSPNPPQPRQPLFFAIAFGAALVFSCSIFTTAQTPSAAMPSEAASPPVTATLSGPSVESTGEPQASVPTASRTRKPTGTRVARTPTDIFDACAEVTGLTADEIRNFLNMIKDFIANEKRSDLAGLVKYPIQAYLGETRTAISSADQFVQHYDQIINSKIRNAVLHQKDEDLRCTYEGVGLTHGEIWFSGICGDASCGEYAIYIIAINNDMGG
ncbi:MAG: hypothetical protein JW929_11560 [Anaerolineales bacterium]|nr:hypothetical protein [Anaerolineales bacterium]